MPTNIAPDYTDELKKRQQTYVHTGHNMV